MDSNVKVGPFPGGPVPPKNGVVSLPCVTKYNLPPDRVLQAALDAADPLDGVVVLGYTKAGDLYMASSYADGGTVVWLMELLKHKLLNHGEP